MIDAPAEPREPAERRLRRPERHEHLAQRRGVGGDPAALPVAGAQRVPRVDLREAGDAGGDGDGDVRGLAGGALELLQEGQGERGEVADGGVAAGVLDAQGVAVKNCSSCERGRDRRSESRS